jgi:hypothetical protein
MNKQNKKGWFRWQRGQALVEYWVTIPAGILIMLSAAAIGTFVTGGFLQAKEGLEHGGLPCESTVAETPTEGEEYAQLDCHSVQLVSNVYDEENEWTTVGYKVISGCDPSISNWILGLPLELQDDVIAISDTKTEWTEGDPNTGVAGLKFENGYESDETDKSEEKGPKDKKTSSLGLIGYFHPTADDTIMAAEEMDSRTVLITLAGYFQWDVVQVSVKAGTEIYYSEITAPVAVIEPPQDANEDGQCDLPAE